MTNVVQFPVRAAELPTHTHIADSLHKLLAASVIERDAFHLGMHIVAASVRDDSRTVAYTHYEASTTAIVGEDHALYVGPLPPTVAPFIKALQGLHFAGGIHSCLHVKDLDDPEVGHRHFSRTPGTLVTAPHTVIYFRLPQLSEQAYSAAVDALVKGHIGGRLKNFHMIP